MENKNEVSAYLENISILLLGLLLFGLPLVFTSLTTDAFTLPKQVLLVAGGLILLLLSGARMISEGSVRIRRTPFDIPVALFGVVLLLSALATIRTGNFADSLIAAVPAIFAVITFFFIINLAKNRASMTFLLTALLSGGAIAAVVSILSTAKVYIFPMPFTKLPEFTTLGTSLDQVMYLVLLLPVVGFFVYAIAMHLTNRSLRRTHDAAVLHHNALTSSPVGMAVAAVLLVLILAGLAVGGYQLFMNRPILLPFDTGFQTAFAAISQDTGRQIQGFLFGSGYGTYSTDFTRFKQASFNLNPQLWTLTFFRSSSFVLELIATTGVVGILSFGYILFTIFTAVREHMSKKDYANPLLISVVLGSLATLLLPFSPVMVMLFFIIVGLFAAEQRLQAPARSKQYHDIELHFVALSEGFPVAATPVSESDHRVQKDYTKILPVTMFILFVLFTALVGFFTYSFTYSDIIFQRSLVAASQNNGLQTYTDQITAIRAFPYRDAYYRIASQTDLALANSLASSVPQGSSPSAQIQQNVTQLIQESIQTARTATELAPQTAANWQNLASVYRGLIGFGQNADQFAIAFQQRAVALNPNDPQGYINLGGIYYQISAWDNAQQAFQTAVNLKPDYANAYYNLGHALESKGDLQNALIAYQQVEALTRGDKQATEKITGEMVELNKKIAQQADAAAKQQAQEQQPAETEGNQDATQPPLEQSQPQTQLPAQKNPVELPGSTTPTPSPKASGTPAPSASPSPTKTQ